jgi:hypothetical protein
MEYIVYGVTFSEIENFGLKAEEFIRGFIFTPD